MAGAERRWWQSESRADPGGRWRGVPLRVPATQIPTLLPDKKGPLGVIATSSCPMPCPLCSGTATGQTERRKKKRISRFSHWPRPSLPSPTGKKKKNLSFMDVCCRWVKYYIKASLMFHSGSHVSRRYRVQNARGLRFYSRFNGSMSIITLALA